jgi:hypothetical protein
MADIVEPNKSPANYEFYFKRHTLTFARIIELDQSGNDTIIKSEYYFKGTDLIKQLDKKENKKNAETVRQLSEIYLVYGKESPE